MTTRRRLLLALGSCVAGFAAQAQTAPKAVDLPEFTRQRMQHQRIIGLTLGGYALANIAASGIAASQTTGETKYFHRMGVYWNLVNLGIAGFGLLGARRQAGTESLAEAVTEHEKMKQILLLNAGLDVAYLMGGAYLIERANRPAEISRRDQLRGFGKAVIVQGGFLMAFDVVNFLIFKNRDKQQSQLIQATEHGVGVVLPIR